MKKVLFVLTAVLAFSVFTVSGAAADDSFEKIKEKGKLTVGFCAQYPPFESQTKTGEFIGFDVDLGKALAKKLNVEPEFKDGEWQGLVAGMNKGDYDILITCMSKSSARKKNANFTDTYFNLNEVILVRKDNNEVKGLKDLKDKVVGVQMATSSEKAVNDYPDAFKEIKKYNYTTEAFIDLKYKRIDAVVCGYAYAVVQNKKDPSYKIIGKPLHSSEIVMVLPKGADKLTKKINEALSAVKKDGTYDNIYKKWLAIK
ncbi:MAG: ABC transporter substrate-binding protein [Thermodesulfobacteriota bacterium]